MIQVNYQNEIVGFERLRHRPIFALCLSSPDSIFIANARFVSEYEIEAWVLDGCDLLESVRTSAKLKFAIDLPQSRLVGEAIARIGESRMGSFDQRFVTLTLCVQSASEEENCAHLSMWLT